MARGLMRVGVTLLAVAGVGLFAAPVGAGSGTTVTTSTTVLVPGTVAPTSTAVVGAGDVAATCDIIRRIDALDVGDPATEDAATVAAQLAQAVALFYEAAAVAPPEISGDLATFADGLAQIQGIVEQIAAQQGQPTPEQQEQLAAMEDQLGPAAQRFQAWALANCGSAAAPATAVAATPGLTG